MTNPTHPVDWPCGPGGWECSTELNTDDGNWFWSCPVHAQACAAGPAMLAAEDNFKRRVLKELERLQSEVFFGGVHAEIKYLRERIRDMPTGMIADSRRMAKGK